MRENVVSQTGVGKMALHRLKVVAVHKARDGDLTDGGGLCIKVVNGTARAAFRFTAPDGRRREAGLGVLNRSSLAGTGDSLVWARELAEKARRLLAEGVDPIEQKKADRDSAKAETDAKRQKKKAESMTLARAARLYHERDVEPSTKLTERHK
ncbi:MAG TPA: Arm DNA-binding domain-containing protein, partial [Caldimonas sp.]